MPCAYKLMTMSSRPPVTRPDRLGTSTGSKLPARSRGTRRCTGPTPGLHPFADGPITGIARVMTRRVVLVIAQMRGHLGLQGPFQHRLDQVTEHAALTGQTQPSRLVPGPGQQLIQQPVVDQLTDRTLLHIPQRRRKTTYSS
jgi:hypothetical protein